ncbi:hypothetical protein ABKA04_008179 [Annulohypoxylon sp. FPYF3050]
MMTEYYNEMENSEESLGASTNLGISVADPDVAWKYAILSGLQPCDDFFEGESPIFLAGAFGEWWDDDAMLQDIDSETLAAGGIRFCCYGMIPNAAVKLVGNMPEIATKIDLSQEHHSFDVSKYAEYFMLKFPDSTIFAQVSELVSRGLAELHEYSSIEIRAFAATDRIREVCSRAKRPSEAILKVEINIYGSVDDAKSVGQKLSSAKIFLQDPDHGMQDIEYRNPHIIQFPGIEEPQARSIRDGFLADVSKTKKTVNNLDEDIGHTISTVYHSLTRSRNLERTQGTHITTQLLPHQEMALSFMIQREFGPVLPEFSLWTFEQNITTPLYRHKLTHAELAEAPNESGGGILADDMGMGKSLSALALVTTTLEQAQSWSQEMPSSPRDFRTRATLVIVPSTLILNSWLREVEKHVDESISITKYYGKARNTDIQDYLNHDVVFTTYHTLAYSMNQSNSVIFDISWFRVILDEAHMIRRRETTLYQAASQLSAQFRWCLTGTPIQNNLEDVGSLLAFLRVKRCHYITFNENERQQYDNTLDDMAKFIKDKVRMNQGKQNQFGIFQAQLQLRLLCNHGTFQKAFAIRHARDKKAEREEFLYSLGTNAGITCSRIDGDQSLSQRQYNMDRFIQDSNIPILLMSTGVGAFGLNLTAANHVYIIEPQWNPSVESQAIGRVSRLGQSKPVLVTRYVVRGTIEISMQSQQIRKIDLAKVGFQNGESTTSDI